MTLDDRIADAFAADAPAPRDRLFEAEALAAAAARQARRDAVNAILRAGLAAAGSAAGLVAALYLAPPGTALAMLAPGAACLCGLALARAWAPVRA